MLGPRRRCREDYCNLSKSCAPHKSAQTDDRGICRRNGRIVCSENIYVTEHAGPTEAPLARFHSDSTLNAITIYFPSCALPLSPSSPMGGEYTTRVTSQGARICVLPPRTTHVHIVACDPVRPPGALRRGGNTLVRFHATAERKQRHFPQLRSIDRPTDRGRLYRQSSPALSPVTGRH